MLKVTHLGGFGASGSAGPKVVATDVLSGGTASSSAFTSSPALAIDGNTGTIWQASGNQENGGWWQIDLGAGNEKKIGAWRQYWDGTSSGIETGKIEASTTGAWGGEEVTIASSIDFNLTGGAGWFQVDFTPPSTAYRYYRITSFTTVNTFNAQRPVVYEFEAYALA